MKRILAALMACLLMATLLAACDKADPANATTAATTESPLTTAPPDFTSESKPGVSDPSDPSATTAPEPGSSNAAESSTAATLPQDPPESWNTEKVLNAYKTAVDKSLAANGQVHKVCNTVIKKPLDADEGLAKLLKIDIAGFNVQNKVCELLGEGKGVYDQKVTDAVQKCTMTAADLTSAKAYTDKSGNTVLEMGIKGGKNPMRNKSPIGRFTWDFCDLDTVAQGIKDAEGTVPGLKINIEKKEFNYSNIKIYAVISPAGKLLRMTHSYSYTAKVENVEVKLLVTLGRGERASGSATGKQEYTFA